MFVTCFPSSVWLQTLHINFSLTTDTILTRFFEEDDSVIINIPDGVEWDLPSKKNPTFSKFLPWVNFSFSPSGQILLRISTQILIDAFAIAKRWDLAPLEMLAIAALLSNSSIQFFPVDESSIIFFSFGGFSKSVELKFLFSLSKVHFWSFDPARSNFPNRSSCVDILSTSQLSSWRSTN